MKIKPKNKFPSWLVKRRLTRVRNKYIQYLKSLDKIPMNDNNYTWAECYYKARAKLYYRFHNWFMGAQSNDDWNVLIAFIKARLIQHFDNKQAWRITEYNALEKINKRDFYRIKSPNLIWHYIAVDKAGRANKLLKPRPKIRLRTNKYNWADVLCNSKIRINNYAYLTQSTQESYWELCFKANTEKIRMRFKWFDWNACIQKNFSKLRRLYNI